MTKKDSAWALLADAKQAKLLRCERAPLDRSHVEVIETLAFDWEGHQHDRPSPMAGQTGQTHAVQNEEEQEIKRFAREVAKWAAKQCESRGIDQLTLFAPPRFLAELDSAMAENFPAEVTSQDTDLMSLTSDELHNHPAIRELIGV